MLKIVDHQFRCSTHLEHGLAFFSMMRNILLGAPKNWRDWPSIQMNLDLGSDNVCMYHACERRFKLNSDLVGDFSHGPNRDQLLGLDDASLKQFMQVHKLSNNK